MATNCQKMNCFRGEQMKRKCQVCGQENGSCNRYYFNPAEIITICPACLAFSSDDKAKIARRAHKDGKLVKEEGAKKNGRQITLQRMRSKKNRLPCYLQRI